MLRWTGGGGSTGARKERLTCGALLTAARRLPIYRLDLHRNYSSARKLRTECHYSQGIGAERRIDERNAKIARDLNALEEFVKSAMLSSSGCVLHARAVRRSTRTSANVHAKMHLRILRLQKGVSIFGRFLPLARLRDHCSQTRICSAFRTLVIWH